MKIVIIDLERKEFEEFIRDVIIDKHYRFDSDSITYNEHLRNSVLSELRNALEDPDSDVHATTLAILEKLLSLADYEGLIVDKIDLVNHRTFLLSCF